MMGAREQGGYMQLFKDNRRKTNPQVKLNLHKINMVRNDRLELENKRQQFWFCCHMLSGNCQARPYLE